MIRLRHTDEWVGLLVIGAALVFFGAILEAGVLRNWFRPVAHLRIVLPQSGVGGLTAGADVEVLGTRAGTVRRVVLNPSQQIYAEADIDEQAEPFIRRDSRAVIRRRFGVAGAAYVDISRGAGAPMDWSYAVIDATTETAPTDTLVALLTRVEEKVFPILDNTKRTMDSLAALTAGMQKGEGTVGQLLTNDTLARKAQEQITALTPAIEHMNDTAKQIDDLAQRAVSNKGKESVPALLHQVSVLLANLETATHEVAHAAPQLPAISRNLAKGTADLPVLVMQTEATAEDLQRLLVQLRGLWLLGGSGRAPPEPTRLPASQIRP